MRETEEDENGNRKEETSDSWDFRSPTVTEISS
jgi:hypothetical protein